MNHYTSTAAAASIGNNTNANTTTTTNNNMTNHMCGGISGQREGGNSTHMGDNNHCNLAFRTRAAATVAAGLTSSPSSSLFSTSPVVSLPCDTAPSTCSPPPLGGASSSTNFNTEEAVQEESVGRGNALGGGNMRQQDVGPFPNSLESNPHPMHYPPPPVPPVGGGGDCSSSPTEMERRNSPLCEAITSSGTEGSASQIRQLMNLLTADNEGEEEF